MISYSYTRSYHRTNSLKQPGKQRFNHIPPLGLLISYIVQCTQSFFSVYILYSDNAMQISQTSRFDIETVAGFNSKCTFNLETKKTKPKPHGPNNKLLTHEIMQTTRTCGVFDKRFQMHTRTHTFHGGRSMSILRR